jgi:hypothetical protein
VGIMGGEKKTKKKKTKRGEAFQKIKHLTL